MKICKACSTLAAMALVICVLSSCSALKPPRAPFEFPEIERTDNPAETTIIFDATEQSKVDEALEEQEASAILQSMDEKNRSFNKQLEKIITDAESDVATVQRIKTGKVDQNGPVEKISVDFFDADLIDVIRLFMTVLEENWTLHDNVGGKVTLHLEDEFDRSQMLELLQGVLRINGAAMVRTDGVWEILPLSEAPMALDSAHLLLPGEREKPSRGQILQGFNLRFTAPSELVNILKPYLSKGAFVYSNDELGLLLICDYPHALQRTAKLIGVFDVSVFADMKIRVFSLKYVLATDIASELEALAKSTGLFEQKGFGGVSFVALDRLNMICVMTKNERVMDFVSAWVDELDRDLPDIVKEEQEQNIFVYYVQNGDAGDIVNSLQGVFNDKVNETKASTNQEKTENVPLGKQLIERRLETPEGESVAELSETPTPATTEGAQEQRTPAGRPSTVSGELAGPVSFVVDEVTNSILVRCIGSDYKKIESVIEKLDIYPKQALIEVIIAEVSLDDSTKLGVEWSALFNMEDDATATLSNDSGLGVISDATPAVASGLSFIVSGARFKGAIKAFAGNNNVQILSSPHILASNHQSATINVGDEVPIVTAEFSTTDVGGEATTTDRSIQYRDVGILLTVTPHINEMGLVRMEISQEISETTNRTVEGTNSPVFSTRTAETKVAVNDGQTVIIGGLMKQQRSINNSGLPGTNRMPILKYLLGYEGEEYRSTELLIFITPHVISQKKDNDMVSKNFLKRLEVIKSKLY